jgi:phenylacetate-CoA ligase
MGKLESAMAGPGTPGNAPAPAASVGGSEAAPSEAQTALGRLQTRKLRALWEALLPANAFYARKLAAAGPDAPLDAEEFARAVPFTFKHELIRDQLEHPPYGTNLTFPRHAYVRCHQTSGSSSAAPLRWLDTQESWDHLIENWLQILQAAGVHSQDRFIFAFSFGPFLGFWSAFEAALRRGCFCFPTGAMTSVARLQAILDNDITVLCSTPTYAVRLGEVAREKKLDLSRGRVRLLVVAGEAGGSIPATRALLASLWPGATVFDHYGMTEVGPVSYQCPAQAGLLHVLENAHLPEVVDRHTGAPVPPGQPGELVLTTLDRWGSPLLRYRTGDVVRARPRRLCACGRPDLALEGGILARADDMVVVRGVNVYPSLVEELVRATGEVAEYRVMLDCEGPMTEMTIEIEPARHGGHALALKARLEQSFQSVLSLRVPVRVMPPGQLPTFEMKAKRWFKTTG